MTILYDKRILVTGATGFIGSHLTKKLIENGAKVSILVKPVYNPWRIKNIVDKLEIYETFLENSENVDCCISKLSPNIIFHLAALSNVARDKSLISMYFNVNIAGTMNLVSAANRIEKIELFINTGTCEEYGFGQTPFCETNKEVPVSPYSWSKTCATYFCSMMYNCFGFPAVTLRPFLTYGPAQETNLLVPSLIRNCIEKKDFSMTLGDQTREFNYVDDIVDGFIKAAEHPETAGEIINIGNGAEYKVRDVAEKIVNIMNKPISLNIGSLTKRIGESDHFFCNNDKAKRLLKWKPMTDLDAGLKKTIDWYIANFGLM